MMQMRHTAHELRVTLDHVLQGGEASAPQNSQEEAVSFLSQPEAEMREVHNIPEVSAHTHTILKQSWEDCSVHLKPVIARELV